MEMPNIAKTLQQPSTPDKKVSDDSNKDSKDSFSDFMDKEVQGNNDKTDTSQGDTDKMEKPENQELPTNVVIPLFPNQIPQPEVIVPNAAVNTAPAPVVEGVEANLVNQGAVENNMPDQIIELEQPAQLKPQVLTENGNKANAEQPLMQTAEPLKQVQPVQQEAELQLGTQPEANQKTAVVAPAVEEKIEVKTEKSEGNVTQFSQAVTGETKADTPVKQAQAPVAADTKEQQVDLQKLSQTMMKEMAKGKTEMEIWLEPVHLGKLAIKVAYEGGKAAVSIICTNEKTMDLISQNAKTLGNILDQHMGTKTVVVIEHPEADYLQQHNNQQNQGEQQQKDDQQARQQDNNNDADSATFLQQLRLGLA